MDKKTLVWLLFLSFGLLWAFRKLRNYFRLVYLALNLPGPPALPILGNVLLMKDTPALMSIGDNISKLYTPLLRGWMFIVPIILVYEPEHLKVILSSTKVSDKNFFYKVMHTFVGDGLVTSTGERWKKNRKLIQPSFQIHLIESYFEDFAKAAHEFVTQSLSEKRKVQVTRLVNTCIVKILHSSILGVNIKKENDTPFRSGEVLVIKRVLKPWLLLDSIFKMSEMSKNESRQSHDLREYVHKVLQERLLHRNAKNICLLDRLIELSYINGGFSKNDVLNETVTFMLAGQDSVGAAVAFCLYLLSKYPEVQNKVYKELTEVCEDLSKPFTVTQINQLHYLEQCIKETMRLLPSIPIVARELLTDVTLGDHTIPAGTNIFISPYATHRLPHIYPDPLKFDPDRFSPDNVKNIHPYGFIPFSLGPRNCIGYKFAYLEMKTILAAVIKSYELTLTPGHEELSLSYRVTLRAKGGIWLDIKSRNKTYLN